MCYILLLKYGYTPLTVIRYANLRCASLLNDFVWSENVLYRSSRFEYIKRGWIVTSCFENQFYERFTL